MIMLETHLKNARIVQDLVTGRPCLRLTPSDKLSDILIQLEQNASTSAGVCDPSGRLIGFITEREIIRKTLGRNLVATKTLDDALEDCVRQDLTAWDVMIPNPDVLRSDDLIEDGLDIITYFGYRSMPVVNQTGALQGVIDARDLNRAVHEKSQQMLKSKDSLLAYFMGSEPYGIGASY